jgi:hypothetical protein
MTTLAPTRSAHGSKGRASAKISLAVIAAGGLAVDAYIHLDLASDYAPIKTSVISQASLFRIEAVLAILAAVVLLARPRRYTAAIALAVAGGGLAALLVYRYVNVGKLGPLPNMYEPVWFTKKLVAAYAEAAAAVAALLFGLIVSSPKPLKGQGNG